jgi:hypothetical protein
VKPYLEKLFTKNRAGGVAQGEGPEFKPQDLKKKKNQNSFSWHPEERKKLAIRFHLHAKHQRTSIPFCVGGHISLGRGLPL